MLTIHEPAAGLNVFCQLGMLLLGKQLSGFAQPLRPLASCDWFPRLGFLLQPSQRLLGEAPPILLCALFEGSTHMIGAVTNAELHCLHRTKVKGWGTKSKLRASSAPQTVGGNVGGLRGMPEFFVTAVKGLELRAH